MCLTLISYVSTARRDKAEWTVDSVAVRPAYQLSDEIKLLKNEALNVHRGSCRCCDVSFTFN